MFEYKYNRTTQWIPVRDVVVRNMKELENFSLSFKDYAVRIGGIVFTSNTKEFKNAVKKEVLWAKIKND